MDKWKALVPETGHVKAQEDRPGTIVVLYRQSMKCVEPAVHRCSCSAEPGLRGAKSMYIRASLRQTQSAGLYQLGLLVKMVILKGEKIQKEQ